MKRKDGDGVPWRIGRSGRQGSSDSAANSPMKTVKAISLSLDEPSNPIIIRNGPHKLDSTISAFPGYAAICIIPELPVQ